MIAATDFSYDVHSDEEAAEFFATLRSSGVEEARIERMRATRDEFLSVELDFGAVYRVEGYDGIAWHAWEYVRVRDEDYEWTGIEEIDREHVVCTMVGDDRKFTFEVEDLTPLSDDEYCGSCGQIGCGHGAVFS